MKVDSRIAVTIGWALVIASLVLQALYIRSTLSLVDILLLFSASVVAGALLSDAKVTVLSFVGSLALAILVMFFCLVLPSLLGISGGVSEILYSGAVVMIFKGIFPFALVFVLVGGFVGSILGERLRMH